MFTDDKKHALEKQVKDFLDRGTFGSKEIAKSKLSDDDGEF